MKNPIVVEGLTDSDGYPVSPWSSRFVEIDDDFSLRCERFVRTVNENMRRIMEAFGPFLSAFRLTAEQMAALVRILEGPSAAEIRTRQAISAQRRRRHR